ncbi:hypothetical protein SAMN05216559_0378 [Halomicrobium zhouii]|uniref:Uncharacterized protein n=1 Tax=Halomicrobium zhouii TaxID=767519 RepID=A0A1I6K8H9_9EURY|nr:hypothetical protein [Halomicrobium zhouii]SFR87585.1 hypothetical protein SAMN05216559_0378 [Halomicrobium zhouii]
MSDEHTNESERSGTNAYSRRRVLNTSLTGLTATGVTGLAGPGTAAAQSTSAASSSGFDREEWDVEIDAKDPDVETRVYVGPEKNASPYEAGPRDIELSEKLVLGTIPDEVPVIGGGDLGLKFEATFGFTEVSVNISICVDDSCLSLAGAGFSYSEAEVCLDTKGAYKGVPLDVEGCLLFNPSINPVGLEIGGSVKVCVGRNLCDPNGKKKGDETGGGWEYSRFCGLCKEFGLSGTI